MKPQYSSDVFMVATATTVQFVGLFFLKEYLYLFIITVSRLPYFITVYAIYVHILLAKQEQ